MGSEEVSPELRGEASDVNFFDLMDRHMPRLEHSSEAGGGSWDLPSSTNVLGRGQWQREFGSYGINR